MKNGLFTSLIAWSLGGVLAAGSMARAAPLRVGVAPTYPPICSKDEAGNIIGADADFARHLGKRLDREVEFVERKFDDLIPALLNNDIDIIMSGMSVTDARKMRVQFSEPYLETGLMALIRRADTAIYDSPKALLSAVANVGVPRGTTAALFVEENMPNASKVTYQKASDAAFDVWRKKIDFMIHDGPSVAWLASEHEAELTGLFTPLTDEELAWGLRRGDTELLAQVNEALAEWKASGVLDQVLQYWLPYLKKK